MSAYVTKTDTRVIIRVKCKWYKPALDSPLHDQSKLQFEWQLDDWVPASDSPLHR